LITRTLALLCLLGAVSTARAEEPLKVVTSIETFADLARRVGGDKVKVDSISHGYQDPHFVEAKPNLMVVLHQADLLVFVGMDLEVGWLPNLVLGSRNEKINRGQPGSLDCSTLIDPLDVPTAKVDRSQGDIHPTGNPHYWIPPVNAVRIAKGITARLSQLRPENREYFDARFAQFVTELKAKAAGWEATAKPLEGTKIVTYHKSFSYVSKWLKLEEQGYIENRPGIPPSPDHLAKLIVMMRANKVKLVVVEDFYNRAIADNVAEKAGATVVAAPSDVGAHKDVTSYFDLVDALLAGLKTGAAK
jgi:zinc/manganese transport system substrate-binding protein